MVVIAHIETFPDQPKQSSRIRFGALGAATTGIEAEVLVHNISATGLVIESDTLLPLGHDLEISLPHAGTAPATVIWVSRRLRGCRFRIPISAATLGAAALRDAVAPDAATSPDALPEVGSFGLRLSQLRLAKGLTQSQLAEQLRVSEPSISHWEKDKSRPKAGRMEALSHIFGIPVPELLGYDDAETLQTLVRRAKEEIGRAAGTGAGKVRITIDM